MTTALKNDPVLCSHCGAELMDDDDLCRFCGKVMVPMGSAQSASTLVSAGLRSLKAKIRPMTADELDETLISADYSNPANPIWDD
ncbi:MAG: hypothetical protein KKA54_14685 [Proteobacteria bacterium]|nr:hypothetical protein [Pseudomonadota bacterium]MBU0967616.1 hypothetical protein [Pseudomonadota bacterium]